jgi:O-antigen/teichoic acid export membrane protein
MLAMIRRDGGDTGPVLCQTFTCLAAVTWPFFLFLVLYAQLIVVVLFGEQWAGSAELLRLMSIGGVFWLAGCIVPPVLTAAGRAGVTLRVQAINQTVAVIGVLLAAPHGIQAVAAAAIPISAIHALVWMLHLREVIGLTLTSLRQALFSAATVTFVSLLLPASMLAAFPDHHPTVDLMLGLLGLSLGWLVGVFLTRHPLSAEITYGVSRLAGALPRFST